MIPQTLDGNGGATVMMCLDDGNTNNRGCVIKTITPVAASAPVSRDEKQLEIIDEVAEVDDVRPVDAFAPVYPDESQRRLKDEVVDVDVGRLLDPVARIDTKDPDTTLSDQAARTVESLTRWRNELQSWPWNSTAWGLPTAVSVEDCQIPQRETRLAHIQHDLEALDLEGQKGRILDALSLCARPVSEKTRDKPRSNHNDYDIATVTLHILRALPLHAEVSDLVDVWTARMAMMQYLPLFDEELAMTWKALDAGWMAIGMLSPRPPVDQRRYSSRHWAASRGLFRESVERIASRLARQVAALGARVDGMLDMLEGLEESIPVAWVEAVEATEGEYCEWIVTARGCVLLYELRLEVGESEHGSGKPGLAARDTPRRKRSRIPGAWNEEDGGDDDPMNDHTTRMGRPAETRAQGEARAASVIRGRKTVRRSASPHGDGIVDSRMKRAVTPADVVRSHIKRHVSQPNLGSASCTAQAPSSQSSAHNSCRNRGIAGSDVPPVPPLPNW